MAAIKLVIIWREERSSIRRLVTGTDGTERHGMEPNTKLCITRSFLELQSPDFAWQFVWTVWTNSKNKMATKTKMAAKKQNGRQKTKWPSNTSYRVQILHESLYGQSEQNTKVQNYKKYKSTPNLAIFWATDSRFCMNVRMDCPTKWQSTKSTKKYK